MRESIRGIVFSFLGVLAFCLPSLAQQDSVRLAAIDHNRERFALFTRCARVVPVVGIDDHDGDLEGLTHEDVRVAVTSRLRAARIFIDPTTWRRRWRLHQLQAREGRLEKDWKYPGVVLKLTVHVVGAAFHVRGELFKRFYDPMTEESGIAVRWYHSSTGTHGDNPGYVRTAIARLLDRFIDDYLRVNTGACK